MCENFLKRVLVVEVPSASFGLEMVEDEASENVERLSEISEATSVIGEESGGIVLAFPNGFAKEHERPGESETGGRFPFFPYFLVGVPRALGHRTVQQTVLGRFIRSGVANFTLGGSPMTCNQVPTRSPLLRVSQMRVPTFVGRALCQILAMTWAGMEFWRLNPSTKARRLVWCDDLRVLL
jgi:hypothetical protein